MKFTYVPLLVSAFLAISATAAPAPRKRDALTKRGEEEYYGGDDEYDDGYVKRNARPGGKEDYDDY
ncbi:18380_t:CDS:2, partial [Gigaspora margarita]